MGGGGGGGSDDAIEYQREQEEQRQARIKRGMAQIDELFSGKDVVTGYNSPTSTLNGVGDGTYYSDNGKTYTLRNGNGGHVGAVRWASGGPRRIQYVNSAKQWEDLPATLYQGRNIKRQGGFQEDFYNKRKKAYVDFALPQLQDQYKDQRDQLTFALARGGNLASSLSAKKNAMLGKDFALQQQNVYDTGMDYANQARSDVAQQKANAVSLLQATADPEAAYNVAQTQANTLSQMPAFSPLQPVISNVASGLGTYLANQQASEAVKRARQGSNYSLPSSWSGSGKVG